MSTFDRVRNNTPDPVNFEIDLEMSRRVQIYAGKSRAEISQRIGELEREWDVERVLETNASALGLAGLALTVMAGKRWIVMPLIILGFLLQQAIQGWCPPIEMFRRMGVRTRQEIGREKYALKALRGDFVGAAALEQPHGMQGERAVEAVMY